MSSLVYLPQESTLAHKDALWALTWAGPNLISGGADGIVRFHDAAALESAAATELPALPLAVSSLSASSDGRHALAAALDGTVALVDVEKKEVVSKCETAREKVGDSASELPAYAAALHPSSRAWASVGRGSKVAVRSIESEGDDALRSPGSVVDTTKGRFGMSVAFSPDGTQIAAGFESGHVAILDAETRAVVATYAAHAMAVRALTWSPDSQWLYSGSDDARIVLHDVRAGSASGARGEGAVATLQGHRGWVLGAAASPDGKLLASGGADGLVKLWDVGQRTCVSTNKTDAPEGDGSVWALAWQPEYYGALPPGKQFAVAGDDKKVSLYRAAGAV